MNNQFNFSYKGINKNFLFFYLKNLKLVEFIFLAACLLIIGTGLITGFLLKNPKAADYSILNLPQYQNWQIVLALYYIPILLLTYPILKLVSSYFLWNKKIQFLDDHIKIETSYFIFKFKILDHCKCIPYNAIHSCHLTMTDYSSLLYYKKNSFLSGSKTKFTISSLLVYLPSDQKKYLFAEFLKSKVPNINNKIYTMGRLMNFK